MQQSKEQTVYRQEKPTDEYPTLSPAVINQIVSDPAFQEEFKSHYTAAYKYNLKYAVAHSIIEDGRFDELLWLWKHFVCEGTIPDEKKEEYKKYHQPFAQSFKDQIHLLLIQKGILPPSSMFGETAGRVIRKESERREYVNILIQEGWPIEVIG